MKEFLKKYWKYFMCFIVGFGLGILVNIPSCNKIEEKIEYIPVHDTITIDSIRIQNHTVTKYVTHIDTCYVVNSDTIVLKDFPIEHKEYNDTISNDSTSANINIKYHGFASGIDSIDIKYNYFKEKDIVIQKPKKFGFDLFVGPYLGYGFGPDITSTPTTLWHGPSVGISIGVGFGYRLTK